MKRIKNEKLKLVFLVLILPITLLSIISVYGVTGLLSSEVSYDRSTSKLRSNNVQDAIDELDNKYKNADDLKCPTGKKCKKLPSITFDANGGTFEGNKETNTVYYYNPQTKISKTSNVDDEGNQTGNVPATTTTDTVTIEGAESLEIEITYQTVSNYSWVAIYDNTVEPSQYNYDNSISGKLYGQTKTTKTYTVTGDTVKFFFTASSSQNYFGYYAKVKRIVEASGTYKKTTKEGYAFMGWNTKEDGSGTTYLSVKDIYTVIEENISVTLYALYDNYKCKRATELHTTICDSKSSDGNGGCISAGMSKGDIITYGSLGTSGVLAAGDAFDCDVNGDDTYDPATERFYFVSNYYDTSTKTFNDDYAVLIYYSNVSGGIPNNTSAYAYYGTSSSYNNYSGPQQTSGKAYYQLPSTSQWSNISLYKTTRAILNENGGNTTSNGTYTITGAYNYGDKAARFLTYQELKTGCPNASTTSGSLDTCKYLMENTKYDTGSYLSEYWLETPASSSAQIFYVSTPSRQVYYDYPYKSNNYAARPVIEVEKKYIEY